MSFLAHRPHLPPCLLSVTWVNSRWHSEQGLLTDVFFDFSRAPDCLDGFWRHDCGQVAWIFFSEMEEGNSLSSSWRKLARGRIFEISRDFKREGPLTRGGTRFFREENDEDWDIEIIVFSKKKLSLFLMSKIQISVTILRRNIKDQMKKYRDLE